MKTVFHATIDGFEIVTALGEPPIAPVETYAVISPILQESPEHTALQAKLQEIGVARRAKDEALADVYRGPPDKRQAAERKYTDLVAAVAALEAEIVPLSQAFQDLRARLIQERAVYHHPRPGEDLVEDATAADLQAKHETQPPHTVLSLDGTYIPDYRGTVHWSKTGGAWSRGMITALGIVPSPDAIVDAALTPEQRQEIEEQAETERVAALTPAQRQAERDGALQAAVQRAAGTKVELEIMGDLHAMEKSQAWYQGQAQEIATKYGE